tara:strand:+ start:23043 stop:24131 length:1089 start_codon:yes stop_codon:yes gene_type:complete
MYFKNIFKDKKIIITGHTGFKGSWLSLWLEILGAKTYGISLYDPSNISHYKLIKSKLKIKSYKLDINNKNKLKDLIHKIKPDFIFHLAAQALVNKSYKDPINTFKTNAIGSGNILNSIKDLNNDTVTVMVTSDKCYLDQNIKRGYKENDLIGGFDPYSASKAMAENLIFTYVNSIFKKNNKFKIGIGRAGNVIGGGDWADQRLIPDIFKNHFSKNKIIINNPNSTRPWQHVLEPLSGYLTLACNLYYSNLYNGEPFNFGPKIKNSISVNHLINKFKKIDKNIQTENNIYKQKKIETIFLSLNCNKSKNKLYWEPCLDLNQTIKFTYDWYYNYYKKNNIFDFSKKQVLEYMKIADKKKYIWAK